MFYYNCIIILTSDATVFTCIVGTTLSYLTCLLLQLFSSLSFIIVLHLFSDHAHHHFNILLFPFLKKAFELHFLYELLSYYSASLNSKISRKRYFYFLSTRVLTNTLQHVFFFLLVY